MEKVFSFCKTKRTLQFMMCIVLYLHSSCEDFITVDPPAGQLVKATVFSDDMTAESALKGLYAQLAFGHFGGGADGLSHLTALSSDELQFVNTSENLLQFNDNALLSTTPQITILWNSSYQYIFSCNSLIEGLNGSSAVTSELKNQLTGEALFIRAYIHFYLVNLFGKIPYITTTNFEKNTTVGRMAIADVYDMIIDDLQEAKSLMAPEYADASVSRTRANSRAASALLAKVFLFTNRYEEAEVEATVVIDDPLYELEDVNSVFLSSSREAIWQLENRDGPYTNDGSLFALPEATPSHIRDQFIASFEPSDLRLSNWILEFEYNGASAYTPFKYKDSYYSTTVNEYPVLLRLGDIYLVRAEARANLDKLAGINSAASDLESVRVRAGLGSPPLLDQKQMLEFIIIERMHELFTEYGSRWIDLTRTGQAGMVLGTIKSDWEPTDVLYPLPYEETLVNRNLPQNDGYN